jgi:hypothetical protein
MRAFFNYLKRERQQWHIEQTFGGKGSGIQSWAILA